MPREPYRVALLTALWKREEIATAVLNYYAAVAIRGIEFMRLAVGSEGDRSRERAESNGWNYLEFPNRPVSDKWNAGAVLLKDWDVDAVVVVGDDDLISRRYFERLPTILRAGRTFAYFDAVHYFDRATQRCVRAVVPYVGAGRMLSRQLLELLEWQPWAPGRDRYLDRSMGEKIHRLSLDGADIGLWHGFNAVTDPAAIVVDIKSDEGIWSFDERLSLDRCYPVDGVALLREHFPDAYDILVKNETRKAASTKEGRDMKVHNKPQAGWILAQVTGNGFSNKAYGVFRAHRGDYFYGPERWIRALELNGNAARTPVLPASLEMKPEKPGPSTTKPAGPETTKPDGPTTTKKDDRSTTRRGSLAEGGRRIIERFSTRSAPETETVETEAAQAPKTKAAGVPKVADKLDTKTREELYETASKLKIKGRSQMTADELRTAIREEKAERASKR